MSIQTIQEFTAQQNIKLNYRYVEPGIKAAITLAVAIGAIALIIGVIALLKRFGIFPEHQLGFLNALNGKAVLSMVAAGGGTSLLGLMIASVIRFRFHLFKKSVSRFFENKENLNALLTFTEKKGEKKYFTISGGGYNFNLYGFLETSAGKWEIEVPRALGWCHTTSKMQQDIYCRTQSYEQLYQIVKG